MTSTFINLYFCLDTSIKELVSYYRDAFPEESITPKLHMLEDHVCSFLRKWGASFGLYGEQCMESLHASMNQLIRSFTSMANKKECLTSVMKEHYMRVNPKSKSKEDKLFKVRTRKRKINPPSDH